MEERQKKISYIGAIETRYGIFPTIAGACVILAIAYIFMNVDLFSAIEQSPNSNIYFMIFVIAAGLIGGALLTWLIINSFRKRVTIADSIDLMMLIVGVGSIGLKYVKDGLDFSNLSSISTEYYVFLGVTIVAIILLVIHACRYKFEENRYFSYRGFETNSKFKTYYEELFKRFPIIWMGLLAILCVAGIFILDSNDQVLQLANTTKGKIIVYVLSGGAVFSYVIGIVFRLIGKKISIIDLGIFMLDIASVFALGISLYRYFTNSDLYLLKLIISIAALVFGAIVTFLLIIGTYIPISNEEKKQNENMLNKTSDEVIVAPIVEKMDETEQEIIENNNETNIEEQEQDSIDEEDADMAEQIKAIVEQLAEQTKVNTTMNDRLNNIDKNLQLIADILKGLATDGITGGSRTIEVPIDNAEVVETPEPEAVAQLDETEMQGEEAVTAQEDYFDNVEETQKIEEQNTQIAADYVEDSGEDDSDWIASADSEVRIKPKMSFEMKLRVADDDIKTFYSSIKNELLSYGIHNRISRHRENFNQGRINICRIVINGKTLKVYLAVDPTSIDARYFHQEDVGHRKGLIDLPTMINVRSKVSARKVIELITMIMDSLVISKKKYEQVDFASTLTLDGFTSIECKGFDYLVKKDVKLSDAVSYPDVFANQLIDVVEDVQYQEKFIKTTMSIDDIVKNFAEGETVDVEAIRKKKLGPANTNYLAITESGELNKKYKVYANEFTPNAIKMICLSGGEAFLVVQPEKTIEEV